MAKNPDPQSFLPLPHLPFHILLALGTVGTAHGYAIIKRIGEMTEGRTAPSSGSLYLAMVRLDERGLLQEAPKPSSEDDARRRYYRLTPLGRRVLEAESQRLAGLVELARLAHALDGRGGKSSRG